MRKFFETIKEFILLFLLMGFGSALIDYARISSGDNPLFCIKKYDSSSKVETVRGMFYSASRVVSVSVDEKFFDSSDISYQLFTMDISVPKDFHANSFQYQITPHFEENCSSSRLYFADTNTKVYLYCIESIDLAEKGNQMVGPFIDYLKKDGSIIEDLLVKMSFFGTLPNDILEFRSNHSDAISTNLIAYRCHKKNINDIYLVPDGVSPQEDFCEYKDDDYDFIWKVIQDEVVQGDTLVTIYEDGQFLYEMVEGQKEHTYVVYPATRGRDESRILLDEVLATGRYSIQELMDRGLQVMQTVKEKEEDTE